MADYLLPRVPIKDQICLESSFARFEYIYVLNLFKAFFFVSVLLSLIACVLYRETLNYGGMIKTSLSLSFLYISRTIGWCIGYAALSSFYNWAHMGFRLWGPRKSRLDYIS